MQCIYNSEIKDNLSILFYLHVTELFKIYFTFRILDSAPVLCPTPPEEPTLSLSGFPQSEKDENKKCVKFCGYYELHNELKILPG